MSGYITPYSDTALIRWPRAIGAIIPDVTVEEHYVDRLQITQHPVASGTPISDHAFLLPKTVTMKCGWTNAAPSLSPGMVATSPFDSFGETRAYEIYQQLLTLQASRQPFQLTAGKRTYENMLISELSVTNNQQTEYALIIEVALQEVIIVKTATTSGAPDYPAPEDTTKPDTTAPTVDNGLQQPQPVPNYDSTLKRGMQQGSDFLGGLFGV